MTADASSQITKEEFDLAFPLPAYMEADDLLENFGARQDRTGRIWAFFRHRHNWAHYPLSARPEVHGRDLILAIRMHWSDEHDETPEGDYPLLHQHEGEKDEALNELLKQFPREHLQFVGAIQLPFMPASVSYVHE